MFRVANLVMVVALLLTAAVVYQLKYASTAEAERLATLRTQIRKEREAIALMKAEWARRTAPIYIQGLVERHLDLKRLDVEAISSFDDLPERPAGGDDRIGGMIEALVDVPLVTSSVGKPASAASEPGAASAGTSAPPATSALRAPSPPPQKPSVPARPAAPRYAPDGVSAAPPPAAPAQASPEPVVSAPPPNPLEQFFSWARNPTQAPQPTQAQQPAQAPVQAAPVQAPPPTYARQPAPPVAPSGGGGGGFAPLLPPVALPGQR